MRYADSPYLADLFAISLRWLALFGLTIALGAGGALALSSGKNFNPLTLITLTLPALWNGFVSALAIYNRRLRWHRQINVGLDMLFCLALFIAAGGLGSQIFWVALLPLFSAAIYFEVTGAVLVAILTSLFQTFYTYLATAQHLQLLPIGIMTGFNLAAGCAVGFLSTPLIHRLRLSYQSTQNKRRESEQKAQRQERDRMQALFSMIETFSSTLNYQTVLDTALDTAIAALSDRSGQVDAMVGAVLLFGDRQELEVRASRGFISHDSTVTFPADQGALRETLQTGEACMIDMPGQDPELSRLLTLQERKSALCLPLMRGLNAYGVMLFAHPDAAFFSQGRSETLQMLGHQAVIALQNASLYQDLAREKERILQSQEEAQKKLARDLHDGPTQSVSAIAMRIEIARRMLEKATRNLAPPEQAPGLAAPNMAGIKETSDELQRIEELARRTTQEIRHMLFTLRPLVLESEGLEAALKTMADKMRDLYQQKVVIDADPAALLELDASHQAVVFYLAEEAVNNARKHARATEIWVRIKELPNDPCIVTLDIIDNGVGFDVEAVMNSYERRGSLGMINLQERAELVNGLLKIDSLPNKGTRVRVYIPLDDEAADRLHNLR
jgi:signal transduction histidine kinase